MQCFIKKIKNLHIDVFQCFCTWKSFFLVKESSGIDLTRKIIAVYVSFGFF